MARHIDYQVDIHVHCVRGFLVYAELVIRPTPDILSKVIDHKKKGQKCNKYG